MFGLSDFQGHSIAKEEKRREEKRREEKRREEKRREEKRREERERERERESEREREKTREQGRAQQRLMVALLVFRIHAKVGAASSWPRSTQSHSSIYAQFSVTGVLGLATGTDRVWDSGSSQCLTNLRGLAWPGPTAGVRTFQALLGVRPDGALNASRRGAVAPGVD